jgi:predicted phosphodiesterase
MVVAGHTHIQEDRFVGSARWVNAGGVGMPYEGSPLGDDEVAFHSGERIAGNGAEVLVGPCLR